MRGINYGPQQLGLLSDAVFGGTPSTTDSTTTNRGTLGRIGDSVSIYDTIRNWT